MNKKFLDKVVDQLVSETDIDYEGKELYVPFTTQSFSSYFPSLFRSYSPFYFHCKDVYGLNSEEIKYVWDKWEVIILDKIRSKDNINESTGMDKKFLDRVTDQIVGETKIDYDQEILYTPFELPFSVSPITAIFIHISLVSFFTHCEEIYGLKKNVEKEYVWKKYISIIGNEIESKDNLNEARISFKIGIDYLDEVLQYLIDNTVFIPFTITINNVVKKSKRGSIIVPVGNNFELDYYYNSLEQYGGLISSFKDEMKTVYGLDGGEITYVWDKYKSYLFTQI
jgi:hypothetical protein